MYMYHWDVCCTTEIIVQFNVLFCVLFAEEDRTSENFMSILEKQVCQKYLTITLRSRVGYEMIDSQRGT